MLRRSRILAVAAFILALGASGLGPAAAATAAPAAHPHADRTVSAAVSSTTCTGVKFNGQLYCPASISGVKSTSYGVGQRVVLGGVSATAVTSTSVTVEALESSPCPPGYFCGDNLTTQTLTVSWSGKGRPTTPAVINLFGTTISANLTPAGYQAVQGVCYIDYC
jgi:hypothetical protein